MNLKKLLECADAKTLIKYFITEIEHTWRMKFQECKEKLGLPVEQILLIIDLNSLSLKDLTSN